MILLPMFHANQSKTNFCHAHVSERMDSPDEYLPLLWQDALWLCYTIIICGAINGVSVHGLFRITSTHWTGTVTRTSISIAGGPQRSGWLTTAGVGDSPAFFASMMLGFGCGAFLVGLVPAPPLTIEPLLLINRRSFSGTLTTDERRLLHLHKDEPSELS